MSTQPVVISPAAPPPVSVVKREVRTMVASELRMEPAGEDGKRYLCGYAATFNSLSNDLGGWRERIVPGAFKRTLEDVKNGRRSVRCVINHDKKMLLGKTSAGTTEIWEDEIGLRFKTLLGERSYEKDLVVSMERKEVNECSFQFAKAPSGDRWLKDQGTDVRELLDVDLYDVSILTADPAYSKPSAELSFRSMFPDGVPEDVQSHLDAAKPEEEAPKPENNEETGCDCACESCVAGNCANCTNTDCADGVCDCLYSQENAINKAGEELRSIQSQSFARSPKAVRELRSKITEDGTLELLLYGDIGENWYGSGITAKLLKSIMDNAGEHLKVRMRINSYGGDAFEGITIGNYMRSLGKPIETCIDGIAASAASVIAMAGDKITMAPDSIMMVHNASSGCMGYATDMRKVAEILDTLSGAIAMRYAKRTKNSVKDMKDLMDAESWMDAKLCIKNGFADELADPGEERSLDVKSMLRESKIEERYQNLPEQIKTALAETESEILSAAALAVQAVTDEFEIARIKLRARIAAAR